MTINTRRVASSDLLPESFGEVRIFLVDDHSLVRRAVRFVLVGESDFDVVGEAGTVADASERVALAAPDVVILDMNFPDGSGLDLCRTLKDEIPSLACLILTASDDDEARDAAVAAGASGFLLKDLHGQDLVDAVRAAVGTDRTTFGSPQLQHPRDATHPAASRRPEYMVHTV